MQVKLSNVIANHFQKDFNNEKPKEVDYGGRGTTKSSKNSTKIVLGMLANEKCDAIVFREDMSHHRNSTFEELQIACDRLLLKHGRDYFTTTSPLEIRFRKGNKIKFGYISDYAKIKGYKPSAGHFFGFIWFFEINEFSGGELHINQAISTFGRGNKPFFKELYEFNVDENRNNFTHEFVEKMKKDPDCIVRFTTYKDLTEYEQQNWLGEIMMKSINNMRLYDYKMYEFIYLGIPRVLKGACHPNFNRDKHVKELDFVPNEITIGIDFGVADAVSAQVAYYQGVKRAHVGKLYYHSNRRTGDDKNINDYTEEVYNKLEAIANDYKMLIEVSVDSANKVFLQLLNEKAINNNYLHIKSVSKSKIEKRTTTSVIQERIDHTNLLLSAGILTIDVDNEELIVELESSKYDEKTGIRLDTTTFTVDTIDAKDYSLRDSMKHLVDYALEKEEE